MIRCPTCHQPVRLERVACGQCNIRFEGAFQLPRLARLSADNYRLAEELVLSGGNLKELTIKLAISYPTLRKRVDSLIEELSRLGSDDGSRTEAILKDIESGRTSADEGLRMIKEMNGEL